MASPEKIAEIRRAFLELIRKFDVPAEARLNGIFLLMSAHGLQCDQRRRAQIQKLFSEFDEAERRRLRKKT